MTASQTAFARGAYTTPVVDYEPAPVGVTCANPGPAALLATLHRPRRTLRSVDRGMVEESPPREAEAFADAALRRILEVIDRRRPLLQLRPLMTPALLDMVFALTRTTAPGKAAVLRRVRLRMAPVDDGGPGEKPLAAEVFATYTRGPRVRAIAARIEISQDRWRMVALQVG